MQIIRDRLDLTTWIVNTNPGNVLTLRLPGPGPSALSTLGDRIQAAQHPAWGTDWEAWLDAHAENTALDLNDGK
jgi:hypothetical protein